MSSDNLRMRRRGLPDQVIKSLAVAGIAAGCFTGALGRVSVSVA
jgi:hypothetical protein